MTFFQIQCHFLVTYYEIAASIYILVTSMFNYCCFVESFRLTVLISLWKRLISDNLIRAGTQILVQTEILIILVKSLDFGPEVWVSVVKRSPLLFRNLVLPWAWVQTFHPAFLEKLFLQRNICIVNYCIYMRF